MNKNIILLSVILMVGGGLRFYGLDWDEGAGLHGDEATLLKAVKYVSAGHMDPLFYVYGGLPIYVDAFTFLAASRFHLAQNPLLPSRFLSALWGVLALGVLYFIGKKAKNEKVGLLSSAFFGGSVLAIQASHYATVESLLVLLTLGVLWASLLLMENPSPKNLLLAAVLAGLALSTKMSSLLLVLPVVTSVLLSARSFPSKVKEKAWSWRTADLNQPVRAPLWQIFLFLFMGIALSATYTSPYDLLSFPEWLKTMEYESGVVWGRYVPVYTSQFLGTRPYIYQCEQVLLYGLGIPLGVAGFLGFGLLTAKALRKQWECWVLLSWAGPYFLIVGAWYVKFLRYMLPLAPIFCLGAAWMLDEAGRRFVPKNQWVMVLGAGCLLGGVYAKAFGYLAVYAHPNTVFQATDWFEKNVPRGAKVLTETPWNLYAPLLTPDPAYTLLGLAPNQFRSLVPGNEADYTRSDDRRPKEWAQKLHEADYLTLASKRLYGALTLYPQYYSVSTAFYRLLFTGYLGYSLEKVFISYPRLGSLVWNDDLAEESFQSFDHAKVLVFKKVKAIPVTELVAMLSKVPGEVPRLEREKMLSFTLSDFQLRSPGSADFSLHDLGSKRKSAD